MKKTIEKHFLGKLSIFLCSLLSVFLTGCIDNNNGEDYEPTPTSLAFFYHGSPDAPDMDIMIDGNRVFNQSIKYTYYSNYVSLTPGNHRVKFTPVNASNAYIDTALTFAQNKAYSLYTVNRLQDIDILVVEDSLEVPGAGKANIRLLNLSPDAPAVDVTTTAANSSALATDLDFKSSTDFSEITSGKYTFKVKNAETGNEILSVSDIQLQEGRIYTLVLRGFSTPPTGNTNNLSMQVITNY